MTDSAPVPQAARQVRRPVDAHPLLPQASALCATLPSSSDVVVIGGGLAGAAVTYYLAAAGVEVVMLERGELNREASGTNAGSFHFQIAIHQLTTAGLAADEARLIGDVRLHAAAAATWAGLEQELDADLGVHVTGGLMVAETPAELSILVGKHRIEQLAGLETEVLTGSDLHDLAPFLAEDLAGASYCPQEGHANPLLAAPAFVARAIEQGARARTRTPVLEVRPLTDGGAARFLVNTPAGTIRAHRVVNAAGAWADEVALLSGLRLPIWRDGLHVNVSEPREPMLTPMLQHIGRRLTLKQAANGTFIIGGGWPARPEMAPARYSVRWSSAAGNAAVAVRVMPALADVRITHMWTGVIAFTDDLAPLIGEFRRLPGYYTCIASTGFTLGPLVARLLVEHMTGDAVSPLPSIYLPDRSLVKS
ncbi:MAG: NAD(P)/FAD-dependent oxidoreductase [Acidimicrobiales bacterium]